MIRFRPAFQVVLLAGAVGACSTGTGQPTAGPASEPPSSAATVVPASPAATRTSGPAPTVPLGPPVRLTLDASGPIVRSDDGPEGRHWVLPAAAARDRDGGFVLFIVWFGDEAGDQIVTVATSEDGRAWRIGKDPILSDLGMDIVHPGAIPTDALQLPDGSWVLYGWATRRTDPTRLRSWRASAPAPEGPWTLDEATVLDTGPAGSWDSQMAVVGAVQPTADGYALWYEGQGIGSSVRGDVGFATSADGLAWEKAAGPSIPRGHCGTRTDLAVQQPRVEPWSGGFAAAVGAVGPGDDGISVFGLTSTDGFLWACASAEPMLRAEGIPGSQGIHTIASVPLGGDRFQLLIESLRDGRSELWSAVVEVGT